MTASTQLNILPPLGRGPLTPSRSVGLLAHAWQRQRQGGRIEQRVPPSVPGTHDGPAPRSLAEMA